MRTLEHEHWKFFVQRDTTFKQSVVKNSRDVWIKISMRYAVSKVDWHDPIVIKVSGGYKMYTTYLVEKQGTALSSDGLTCLSQMTQVSFVDSSGNILTEGDQGVGDFGGVL